MATAIEILNTIRDNSSDEYIARIPAATQDNLHQVGKAITEDSNIMNEFMSALINKVAFSNIRSKMFENPLARLKSVGVPYGSVIEEIFINPATDMGYQKDGTFLLKTTTPDGKTAYYGQNRKSSYPLSINEPQIVKAFTNEQEFMSFYNAIVSALYSGDNIDEFTLSKRMLGLAIDNGGMLVADCDLTQPKELAKSLSNTSKMFTFPNTAYCGYNLVNKAKIDAGETACTTFCPTANQCLLLRADAETEMNYEFLANAFNIDLVTLKAMTIIVDDIPSENYDVFAVLCDKETIQIRDNVFRIETEFIKSNLTWNLWLHHWQYIFLSMFGNACAFAKKKTE